jgi:HK97 family phage major capsid protein
VALKQLILRKKLEAARAEADKHRAARSALEQRQADLLIRERAAEAALNELSPESTQEERDAVDQEAETIEAEQTSVEQDIAAHDAEQTRLDGVVSGIEAEVEQLDERSAPPANETKTTPAPQEQRGRREFFMKNRTKFFDTIEQRDAFFAREEVKGFIDQVRASRGGSQNRAVSGATLTIPDTMLAIMRDNMTLYSKLIKYVSVKPIRGESRQPIMGAVPEAVWMEVTGALNELDMSVGLITMDAYLLGGFIPIANPYLEDSDLNLGMEIMDQLGKAIGKALDRAIVYGTGTNMMTGFVTRLAQSSQPSSWDANAPAWTDLSSSNIKKLNIASTSGATFFAALAAVLGIPKPEYSDGQAVWIMNRKTHMDIKAKLAAFDAAGALVAGLGNQMPIIGGDIVELETIGDYEIAGGFLSLFIVGERSGAVLSSSEHVRFIQNQTVFKGLARYDGKPAFGEGFVLVSYDNTDAATTTTWPVDYANTALGVLGVTAAAGSANGDTVLTVTGTASSGTTLKFKIGDLAVSTGDRAADWTALTSGTTQITCAAGKKITVVELDGNGRAIKAGKVVSVPKA